MWPERGAGGLEKAFFPLARTARVARVSQLIDSVTPPKENIISRNLNNQSIQLKSSIKQQWRGGGVVGGGVLTSQVKLKKKNSVSRVNSPRCGQSARRISPPSPDCVRRRAHGSAHHCGGPAQASLLWFVFDPLTQESTGLSHCSVALFKLQVVLLIMEFFFNCRPTV